MKIFEIILEGKYVDVATHEPGYVYTQFNQALKAAEKRGMKVIKSAGGYYKLAGLDDPNPALQANTARPAQIAKIQAEIDFLNQGLRMYYDDKDSYKRIYYRKYGLPKAISARIAQLKRDIEDLPYAVDSDTM